MGRRMRTFNDLVGRWNVDLVADDDQAGEWDFDDEPEPTPAASVQPASPAPARPVHWWNQTLPVPYWAVLYIGLSCGFGTIWIALASITP